MFDTLNNFRGFTLCLFQDFLNSLLLGILLFVFFTVVCIILGGAYSSTGALSYSFSELFCILIPILFLSLQLLLSVCCLYQASSLDTSCDITVKITGHQWFWVYEYSGVEGSHYSSSKLLEDYTFGESSVWSADQELLIPVGSSVRLCVTSSDVIHSWFVPSLNVNLDAVPGSLSVETVSTPVVGSFYGYCSEICGANHSHMPVFVNVVPAASFVLTKLCS